LSFPVPYSHISLPLLIFPFGFWPDWLLLKGYIFINLQCY
jgi:hypothetical protein